MARTIRSQVLKEIRLVHEHERLEQQLRSLRNQAAKMVREMTAPNVEDAIKKAAQDASLTSEAIYQAQRVCNLKVALAKINNLIIQAESKKWCAARRLSDFRNSAPWKQS